MISDLLVYVTIVKYKYLSNSPIFKGAYTRSIMQDTKYVIVRAIKNFRKHRYTYTYTMTYTYTFPYRYMSFVDNG
jgi:hypothetical protein